MVLMLIGFFSAGKVITYLFIFVCEQIDVHSVFAFSPMSFWIWHLAIIIYPADLIEVEIYLILSTRVSI